VARAEELAAAFKQLSTAKEKLRRGIDGTEVQHAADRAG
jgi:hypothetical protein